MIKNDLIIRAARGEQTERTPVWLMRQAGRFDPAYMSLRERADLPLEKLFSHPDFATEISLLPRRFGVDAIIFFQDILTPLGPMGAGFRFRPGPVLAEPVRTRADVDRLTRYDPSVELGFVGKTLQQVRSELAGELPLLGFAGAPLTLACFLIEGKSPGDSGAAAKAFLYSDPAAAHALLANLADMTVDYLLYQIESGADMVQLFESCAELLSDADYEEFAQPYQQRVLSAIRGRVPTILFAKEYANVERMADTGADVISVGGCVDLAEARRRVGGRVALQGNLNNRLLATGTEQQVIEATRDCIAAGGCTGHILNLNHGLLKETPVANVQTLIDACKLAPGSARPDVPVAR